MELSSEQYDQLVNWLDRQRRRVTELEAENRELRRQLDELRRGVGVSLVIEGRAIPVAALPLTGTDSVHAASLSSSQHPAYQRPAAPASASHPMYPTPTRPAPHTAPSQPMRPETSASPALPSGRRGTAARDSAWLTGQIRAVRAPVAPAMDTGSRRISTPSQDMTPTWLREEEPLPAPTIPSVPPSWPSRLVTAAPKPRTLASVTGKQAAVRAPSRPTPSAAPVPAHVRRPVAPRLEPEHLPSLAQMTGHRPAARLSGAPSVERSPFSDSFVLG